MKILMISPYLPWPLHGGASVRIFNLLRELSRRGHQIVLLAGQGRESFSPSDHILNQICELHLYKLPYKLSSADRLGFMLRSLFSSQPYPASKFLVNSLKVDFNYLLNNRNFDLIWINFLILADVLPSALIKNTPVVLDQHECEELVYKGYLRQGRLEERLFALFNLIKIRKLQQKIFSRINAILCVSQQEADFIRNKTPKKVKVWVVPNGVAEEFFQPIQPLQNKANHILLCSNMNVQRNIDAAIWFVKNVFPKIKEKIPDAKFWIVGANPTPKVWKLNSISGVKVTGTVDNIRDYYQKGKVFVAPYRFGAGTKLKVLEAMASGIPVVSTNIGCRGIDVIDGEHLLIADNEDDFANRVVELLTNFEKREKLALAARKLVKEKYSWKKIVDELEPKLLDLVYARKK